MAARFVAAAVVAALLLGCADEPLVEASAPPPIPAERLGPELTVDTVPDEAAGFALQVQEGVVLTTSRGNPLGHLPGWSLDRRRSDRLAAPVLLPPEPAGESRDSARAHVMTSHGLLPVDGRLPLGAGHEIVIREETTEVYSAASDDDPIEVLDAPADDIWLSVLGDVVNAVRDRKAYNVRTTTLLDLPDDCRIADQHRGVVMLYVCDGGARVRAGAEIPAPDDRRWRWVSTGIEGTEVVASSTSECGGRRAHFGTLETGTAEALRLDGKVVASEALLVRTSGDAWVALLGSDCDGSPADAPGLYSRSATDGTLTRLGDRWPGLAAAAMWAR